jgi:hypothetical protein
MWGTAVDISAWDDGEIFEPTVFLHHFNDAAAALLATLAGAETFTDIARSGEKKLVLFRCFRPFKDGTPPRNRIGDIFATLDAEQFQRCCVAWVASVTGMPEGVIAIDGNIVRRSGRKKTTLRRSIRSPPLRPGNATCFL